MIVIGIDPGPKTSGFVVFDGQRVTESRSAYVNEALIDHLRGWRVDAVVIERVQNYGRIIGASVFDTLWWSGRFYQAAKDAGSPVTRVYWNDVKRQYVGPRRRGEGKVTEATVRKGALIRFGGAAAAKGTKAVPGPCAGVTGHAWSALALAVYWWDRASAAGIVTPRPLLLESGT